MPSTTQFTHVEADEKIECQVAVQPSGVTVIDIEVGGDMIHLFLPKRCMRKQAAHAFNQIVHGLADLIFEEETGCCKEDKD